MELADKRKAAIAAALLTGDLRDFFVAKAEAGEFDEEMVNAGRVVVARNGAWRRDPVLGRALAKLMTHWQREAKKKGTG